MRYLSIGKKVGAIQIPSEAYTVTNRPIQENKTIGYYTVYYKYVQQ